MSERQTAYYTRTLKDTEQAQANLLSAFESLNEDMAGRIMLQWFREFWGWWIQKMKSPSAEGQG